MSNSVSQREHQMVSHIHNPLRCFQRNSPQPKDLLSITHSSTHQEGLTQLLWFSLGNQQEKLNLSGLPRQQWGKRRGNTDGGTARRERWWRGDSGYGGLTGRSNPTREQDIHLNEKGKMSVGKEEEGMAKRRSCLRPGAQRKAKGRTKDIHTVLKSCIRKTKMVAAKVPVTCSASPWGKLSNLIPPLLLKIIALHTANGFGRLPSHHNHHLHSKEKS